MTLDTAQNVFPLPLTTFESYMLTDDSTDYPMTIIRQLLVSGRVQKNAFGNAIHQTLLQHPLLTARIDRSQKSGPVWSDAGKFSGVVDWGDIRKPLLTPDEEFIDLAHEPGFRVWVRQADAKAVVTLQFHHACCDGTGAMQFIADLLAAYSSEIGQKVIRNFSSVSQHRDLLALRDDVFIDQTDPITKIPVTPSRKFIKALHFFLRKPTPLLSRSNSMSASVTPSTFPHLLSYQIQQRELRQIQRIAKQNGATLNDWLLRDLFRVLRIWNRGNFTQRNGRWLRITMPVNLRKEKHQSVPAANIMSYGFLTRDEKYCDSSDEFLRGIIRETREIKFGGSALMFLKAVGISMRIPGSTRRMESQKRCYATVVLSNVGDVTSRLTGHLQRRDGRIVAGDIILEAVRGCPPFRRNTNLVFHVMTYAGCMTVATRFNPRVFSAVDANEFLSRYVRQLYRSSGLDEQTSRSNDSNEPLVDAWESITISHDTPTK